MKKFTLALVFTFLLAVASASAAYQYTTIWTSNGQPVNGVRSFTASCQNTNCDNPLGATVQDITAANNQVTTIYPTPSPTYGYATYWSAACYVYQELPYKPSGSGSTTANLQFTKQNDCRSDILNVQVPSSVPFGSSVSITAQVKSALTEFNHLPAGEPTDANFVDSFLSDRTQTTLTIRNANNQVVDTQQQEALIRQDTNRDYAFMFTPAQAGTYTIEIKTAVTDCKCSNKIEQTTTRTFTVQAPPNNPPIVVITQPASGSMFIQGTTINFRGSATDTEEGTLSGSSLRWQSSLDGNLGTGTSINMAILRAGIHTITLTATDSGGLSSSATITVIIVADQTATAILSTSDPSGIEPFTTTFSCTGTGNSPLAFQISFGDGQSINAASATHTYAQQGTYTARCTVTDADGDTAQDSDIIQVSDSGPNAAFTVSPLNPIVGQSVLIDGSPSTGYDQPLAYAWNFGDGTTAVGVSNTHAYALPGTYTLTLIVTDADGTTDTETRSITVAQSPNNRLSISVDKQLNSSNPARFSQPVVFDIAIVNTGTTTINTLPAGDLFRDNLLQFQSATINPNSVTPIRANWNDLTAAGTLAPGASLALRVTFSVLGNGTANNTIYVNATDNVGNVLATPVGDSAFVTILAPQCRDGADNDGDGATDLSDPGCTNANDDDESGAAPVFVCNDGADNDGDGLTDFGTLVTNDPGCANANDNDERDPTGPQCDNGADDADTEDTLADFPLDLGCTGPTDNDERNTCNDGLDNDGDGSIDLLDFGCTNALDTDELNNGVTQCSDGINNDAPEDLLIDQNDPGCVDANDNDEVDPIAPACSDIVDNDGDGLTDFGAGPTNDPGCANANDNDERDPTGPQCDNGADDADTEDTLADFPLDLGCTGPTDNDERNTCNDGLDNDGDGSIDLLDFGCTNALDTDELNNGVTQCSDGINNDAPEDLLIDQNDPGCVNALDDDERNAIVPVCRDGLDNDGDGLTDFGTGPLNDPGCANASDNDERNAAGPACDNGLDDDGDGFIDFGTGPTNDPDCTDPTDDFEQTITISLVATKTRLTADPITPGMPVQFTLTIQNLGNVPITDLAVQDTFDGARLTYVSGLPVQDRLLFNTLTWDAAIPDTLAPGASVTIGATFTATQLGNTFNQLIATAEDPFGGVLVTGDIENFAIVNTPECNDGADNDGDGLTDFGTLVTNDPGCADANDNDERDPTGPQCDNGADDADTEDTLADFPLDLGCTGPTDNDERNTCNDGLDNDGDGSIDLLDFGCTNALDTDELNNGATQCSDGINNDAPEDLLIDQNDPGCVSIGDDDESDATSECQDGIDNDNDRLTDYPFDPGCDTPQDGSETDPAPLPECFDADDNDADGLIDFPLDPGCIAASDDDESNGVLPPDCRDGTDNDADGLIDFPFDPGCADVDDTNEVDTLIFDCSNGLDDDRDGLTDFPADPGCLSAIDDDESNTLAFPECSDGIDNADAEDLIADFPFDSGCVSPLDRDETDPATVPVCADGLDNELPTGDSLIDFGTVLPQIVPPNDPGCYAASDPDESDATSECQDGIDNDGDGINFIDYPFDSDCTAPTDNTESGGLVTECSNGIDDETPIDGLVDYPQDTGCVDAADDDELLDTDLDGIDNAIDNCPLNPNPLQEDLDLDDQGDVCDSDIDGDGIPNTPDNCPLVFNPAQTDTDTDGIGDACDSQTCGNALIEGTEVCDGTDLAAQSCTIRGFDTGVLSCNAACTAFDQTQCRAFLCNDGQDNDGDGFFDFDGADTDGDGIVDAAPDAGCVALTDDDETDTPLASCGNGILQPGETCDLGILVLPDRFGGLTCLNFDSFTDGSLLCNSGCQISTVACTGGTPPGSCGDDVINTGEQCDGAAVFTTTSCLDFGNYLDTPITNADCTQLCQFNTGNCIPDTDLDTVPDQIDNCPTVPNTDQLNTDGTALGDACDPDDDDDLVLDGGDNCPLGPAPFPANPDQTNTDPDSMGNVCDPDDDDDTVLDGGDNCPLIANTAQSDLDNNGRGDACDPITAVAVSKTAQLGQVQIGQQVSFDIVVRNPGTTPLGSIVVIDVYPTAFLANPISTLPRYTAIPICDPALFPNNYCWQIAAGLAPSASSTITVTFDTIAIGTADNPAVILDTAGFDPAFSQFSDNAIVVISAIPNTPPTAQITAPADPSSFTVGTTVSLQGTGADTEDGPLTGANLAWSSDIDDALGTGGTLNINALSIGTHVITLTATDSGGATGTDTITLTITPVANTAPTVTIDLPVANPTIVIIGTPISFTATATDIEDNPFPDANIVWDFDDATGATGTAPPAHNFPGIDTFDVVVTVTDTGGLTATDTIQVIVVDSPVTILTLTKTQLSPAGNPDAGEVVTFNIHIENTGTAAASIVSLQDTYPTNLLRFQSSSHTTVDTIDDGALDWTDVTGAADLAAGASIDVTVRFLAMNPGTGSNVATTPGFPASSLSFTIDPCGDSGIVTNSFVDGIFYVSQSECIWPNIDDSPIFDATISGIGDFLNDIRIFDSTIIDGNVTNSYLTRVSSTNGNTTNSILTDYLIINATVKNIIIRPNSPDPTCINSVCDPPSGLNDLTGSKIENGSITMNSDVTYSNVDNSTISNSTIDRCTITNSVFTNVTLSNCTSATSDISDIPLPFANFTSTNTNITGTNVTSFGAPTGTLTCNNGAGVQTYTTTTTSQNLFDLCNFPPTARGTVTPTVGDAGATTFTFADAGSSDPNIGTTLADTITLTWNFGDGSTPQTGTSVTYVYPTSGTYVPTLRAVDRFGASHTISLSSVAINSPSSPPSGGGSGGGGGGGGGGGSGGGRGPGNCDAYLLGNQDTFQTAQNTDICITHKGKNYTMTIQTVQQNSVRVALYDGDAASYRTARSTPRTYTFDKASVKYLDLDQDTTVDLAIALLSIAQRRGTFQLTRQNVQLLQNSPAPTPSPEDTEPAPEPENTFIENIKEGILNIASEATEQKRIPWWIGPLLIGVILLLSLSGYFTYRLFKRRKQEVFITL